MSGWISVSDQIPDIDSTVLLCVDVNGSAELTVGSLDVDSDGGRDWRIGNSSLIWDYHYSDDSLSITATHWQPLPTPPTE